MKTTAMTTDERDPQTSRTARAHTNLPKIAVGGLLTLVAVAMGPGTALAQSSSASKDHKFEFTADIDRCFNMAHIHGKEFDKTDTKQDKDGVTTVKTKFHQEGDGSGP